MLRMLGHETEFNEEDNLWAKFLQYRKTEMDHIIALQLWQDSSQTPEDTKAVEADRWRRAKCQYKKKFGTDYEADYNFTNMPSAKESASELQSPEKYPIPSLEHKVLQKRIASLHGELVLILNGDKDSHSMPKDLRTLRASGLKEMIAVDRNIGPGYYGTAGEERIHFILMKEFENETLPDPLVQLVKYVQDVLSPETVNLLIMEDMGVAYEDANEIRIQSDGAGPDIHDPKYSDWFGTM